MANPTTIELPRIEGESNRAYAARVEYVTMGAGRSLDALSQKYTKNIQLYKKWSAQYGWVDSARQYDEQLAYITIQEASEKHRADLEIHRKQAMDAGRSLYGVAGQMLQQLNTAMANPKKIKGEDGRWYTLHGIEMTSATLTTVARALQTALDLTAHALGVDEVLGRLADDSE
jgi:hypothetical protein